jgi:UDP-2,3-diacylglucosamine pyrophosphatase LpxH
MQCDVIIYRLIHGHFHWPGYHPETRHPEKRYGNDLVVIQ